ncbi:MAG: ParA family protein [Chitinivibrionales bacterium]|nr:ParA family protein [Chitinivibrionales bacterium]
MKIIAICNQKGGVGKTTTAINLSACLAVSEKKTLLIDLDAQGNATTGMGVNKHDIDLSIYDVLTGHKKNGKAVTLSDTIIKNNFNEFFDLVPASVDLAGMELELVNTIAREKKLTNTLDDIKGKYDYVILDSPPSLGLVTINVLAATDAVIIPIQCEYYALEGMAELLNTIRLVQKNLNKNLVIEGVLLTMYDSRLNLSRQVAEDVRNCFSGKVFKSVVPRNVKLSEAPSFGKPIIFYDIMSAGAESYLNLAKEIMNNDSK